MKLFHSDRASGRFSLGSFDPERQYAVVRSSVCTGEKVAGFKDRMKGVELNSR